MPRIRRLRTGRDRTILRAARRWAAPSDDSSGYAQGSAQQAPANRTSGFLGRLWETNTVPAMRRNRGTVYASHHPSNKSRAYASLKTKRPPPGSQKKKRISEIPSRRRSAGEIMGGRTHGAAPRTTDTR